MLNRPVSNLGRGRVDREASTPGTHISVYPRKADGYTRIEVESYTDKARVVFYANDDERAAIAKAIAGDEA